LSYRSQEYEVRTGYYKNMKRKSQIFRIEEEYRNISQFLARSIIHENDGSDAYAEYKELMNERARLKNELWKKGNKDLVLQIDQECIQEQMNNFKLRWGRDDG